jgi:diguanylate cyclase (GGDEF)-like protein
MFDSNTIEGNQNYPPKDLDVYQKSWEIVKNKLPILYPEDKHPVPDKLNAIISNNTEKSADLYRTIVKIFHEDKLKYGFSDEMISQILSSKDTDPEILSSNQKSKLNDLLHTTFKNAIETFIKDYELTFLEKDSLTGLNNRVGFQRNLERIISEMVSERNEEEQNTETKRTVPIRQLAILMLDLNNFKQVNDNFGHPAGDKALIDVANIMKETFRATDILARFGGDEFGVALPIYELNDDSQLFDPEILYQSISSKRNNIQLEINGKNIEIKVTACGGLLIVNQEELKSLFPHDENGNIIINGETIKTAAEKLIVISDAAETKAKNSSDKNSLTLTSITQG